MKNKLDIQRAEEKHAKDMGYVQSVSWRATYAGLMLQSYLDKFTPQQAAKLFLKFLPESKHEFYIAYLNRKPVGRIVLGASRDRDTDQTIGEIAGIYLVPDHWEEGLGTELTDFALQRLAHIGFAEAILWVAEENERAVSFYTRYGFIADGAKRDIELGGGCLPSLRFRKFLSQN